MKLKIVAACAALLVAAGPIEASAAPKEGSQHVQCDGQPPSTSAIELVGQLVAITATAGVVGGFIGASETEDVNKRTIAEKGVAACTAALASETNDMRRAQLTLARAIHELERQGYEAALRDARALPAAAGKFGTQRLYDKSLGLSALEIEATALAGLDRSAEAEAAVMRMAQAAPYDVLNTVRVSTLVGITSQLTPQKLAYLDHGARLWPSLLSRSAAAKELAGDYAGAAVDYGALAEVFRGFSPTGEPPRNASHLASEAVARAMAGDAAGSRRAAELARSSMAALEQAGLAVNTAPELLDFHAAALAYREGRIAEARRIFGGRSRWSAPSSGATADLTAWLRAGAQPDQLVGALSLDPDVIRRGAPEATRVAALSDKSISGLYRTITFQGEGAYAPLARMTWRTDKSRFHVPMPAKPAVLGELYIVPPGYDLKASGVALIMHCALVARSRGQAGFVVYPVRTDQDAVLVRFGNPGDPGLPERAMLFADKVIADLSPLLPEPGKR